MGFKRPESVLVLIENQDKQVLVMQRNDDPNFWQSVTGTIEENEEPLQTAYREVCEETGLDLHSMNIAIIDCQKVNKYQIRKDWLYRYPPGTQTNREYVFKVTVPNSLDIILTEHLSYEWLEPNQAKKKVWSPSNAESIQTFLIQERV